MAIHQRIYSPFSGCVSGTCSESTPPNMEGTIIFGGTAYRVTRSTGWYKNSSISGDYIRVTVSAVLDFETLELDFFIYDKSPAYLNLAKKPLDHVFMETLFNLISPVDLLVQVAKNLQVLPSRYLKKGKQEVKDAFRDLMALNE